MFISFGSNIGGHACGTNIAIQKNAEYTKYESRPTLFFDTIVTSMKSINQIIFDNSFNNTISTSCLTQVPDEMWNIVKFDNFDYFLSYHDLDIGEDIQFKKNELVEKYIKRRDRLLNIFDDHNKINQNCLYFIRYEHNLTRVSYNHVLYFIKHFREKYPFIKFLFVLITRHPFVSTHKPNQKNKNIINPGANLLRIYSDIQGIDFESLVNNPNWAEIFRYISGIKM